MGAIGFNGGDMEQVLIDLCDALDELSEKVLASSKEERSLKSVYGWHHPSMTKSDLARIPETLSLEIKRLNASDVSAELSESISEIPSRLQELYNDTVPYMFNGHGNQAIPAYLSTMQWVRQVVDPLFSWENLQDNKTLPPSLSRRLRNIQRDLDQLIVDKSVLLNQIKLINDAVEAAENLPTDLQSLKEARHKVSELEQESFYDRKKISDNKNSVEEHLKSIRIFNEEAQNLVIKCEDAYRVTTTRGLALAFDERASDLKKSMRLWVGGLLLALCVGAWIGHERIELLTTSLSSPNLNWGIIWIQIILSLTSVVAPLWFAWLATKQISQRFKLAEDYDFKASVAKAYEGYKKEAIKFDSDFETRLFNVALTRLEEAPLRLMDSVNHGSPTHEVVEKTGLNKVGGKIVDKVEDVIDSITPAKASNDG